MGYHCPERQTTADFLTSLTNPAERIVQPGAEAKVPKTPDEFAKAWEDSAARQNLLDDIAAFEEQYPLSDKETTDRLIETRKAQQASLM